MSAATLIAKAVALISKLPARTLPLVIDILTEAVERRDAEVVLRKARAAARMQLTKGARDALIDRSRKR